MSLNQYTYEELTEMHLCYGAAGRNLEFARQLYKSRFPERCLPSEETFKQIHRSLCEFGSFSAFRQDSRNSLNLDKRREFCHWFNNHGTNFSNNILFTDEQQFRGNGINHNFSLNVWCGIFGQHLIGPVFLPLHPKGEEYLEFLKNDLTLILRDIPLGLQQCMWFMHDGAPWHSYQPVKDHLNRHFSNRWIGKDGPVAWPPYSCDLNPIDFYVWDKIKRAIDNTQTINSLSDFQNQIYESFETFRSDSSHFEEIGTFMDLRISMCIAAKGDAIRALLQKFLS